MYARLMTRARRSTSGRRRPARRCWPARPATSSSAATSSPTTSRSSAGSTTSSSSSSPSTLFLDGVPDELLDEKLDELGIDRAAFDRDVAQVRRLTPGPGPADHPPRPRAASARRRTPSSSSVSGPRLRAWINREDRNRVKVILTKDVAEARQERRDEAGRRRLRHELPHPAEAGRARPPAAPTAPGSTTSPAARTSASASARRPRSRRPGSRSTTLTMGVKVGEGGKLYGSITSKDIADALGPPRHRGRPPQDRPRGAAQVARHVQGRDQGLRRA